MGAQCFLTQCGLVCRAFSIHATQYVIYLSFMCRLYIGVGSNFAVYNCIQTLLLLSCSYCCLRAVGLSFLDTSACALDVDGRLNGAKYSIHILYSFELVSNKINVDANYSICSMNIFLLFEMPYTYTVHFWITMFTDAITCCKCMCL